MFANPLQERKSDLQALTSGHLSAASRYVINPGHRAPSFPDGLMRHCLARAAARWTLGVVVRTHSWACGPDVGPNFPRAHRLLTSRSPRLRERPGDFGAPASFSGGAGKPLTSCSLATARVAARGRCGDRDMSRTFHGGLLPAAPKLLVCSGNDRPNCRSGALPAETHTRR